MKINAATRPVTTTESSATARGKRKNHFHIKEHEDQRHQVVAEVELHPGRTLGLDPALVRVRLDRVRQPRPQPKLEHRPRSDQRKRREHRSKDQQNAEVPVLLQDIVHQARPRSGPPRTRRGDQQATLTEYMHQPQLTQSHHRPPSPANTPGAPTVRRPNQRSALPARHSHTQIPSFPRPDPVIPAPGRGNLDPSPPMPRAPTRGPEHQPTQAPQSPSRLSPPNPTHSTHSQPDNTPNHPTEPPFTYHRPPTKPKTGEPMSAITAATPSSATNRSSRPSSTHQTQSKPPSPTKPPTDPATSASERST